MLQNFINKAYDLLKPLIKGRVNNIIPFEPGTLIVPHKMPDMELSAWKGLELLIPGIIRQSGIQTKSCLEFGVEFGYSTAAFANYFDSVIGVDIFTGDMHAGIKPNMLERATKNLERFNNITLIKSDYKDFTRNRNEHYDLIHVDIIHTYEDTYACGLWAAMHSSCTLFHDTESFPEVKQAVIDIAKKTKKSFYNYPFSNGLSIVY